MPSSDPKRRFQDIIDNIATIEGYVAGMDKAAFLADRKTFDATERCLSRISEAAVKLDDEAEKHAPGQAWSDIRGLGNWLRHAYPSIEDEIIWKIVSTDLGLLKEACQTAIAELDASKT